MTIYEQWLDAKAAEKAAQDVRRVIEDKLIEQLSIDEFKEGSQKREDGDFIVKCTGRINRKIDADLVQEIAAENGLSEHLSQLFRWTPAINMTAWKQADQSITNALAAAITAKPGRVSFSIERKES